MCVSYSHLAIVRYLPKQKRVMRKNLMSGEEKEVLIPVEEPSALTAPLGGNTQVRTTTRYTTHDDSCHTQTHTQPPPLTLYTLPMRLDECIYAHTHVCARVLTLSVNFRLSALATGNRT